MNMHWIGTAVLVGVAGVAAAAEPTGRESPYLRPEFRRLMDAVTFHVSFDRGTMMPDMAEGAKYLPTTAGAGGGRATGPEFSQGIVGQALVLGSGAAVYPRAGNVLLGKRGAVALWIKPENWQRPRDGNCVFAMTTNSTFYLERQGPDVDDDGRVRRHETILYLVGAPKKRLFSIAVWPAWENGRWYLLVANWSWPTFELSVNGGPFEVQSTPETLDDAGFGDLVLGQRGGPARGLLDEFMAFRRPLTLEEARLLCGSAGERASK